MSKMSSMFKKIKAYYDTGLWNEKRVRNMVSVGRITEEEYEEIVGIKYEQSQDAL